MQNISQKRYVIQKHIKQNEPVHWDIMLEKSGILETYRCDLSPVELLNQTGNLVKIFDHEVRFLEYEGPVNKGLGKVCIEDHGFYKIISQEKNSTIINFNGQILKGSFLIAGSDPKFQLSKQEG